jgi:Predicted metal-dependent phosphoesterases (PHP family)
LFVYSGSLHIHSKFSDGSGDVKDIAALANEAGLDFIILTDHNTLRAKDEGYEGFYGNTLLIVGCEINDKENKNHYLALGTEKTFSTRLPAAEYVKQVKEAGGIGFLAHPHEKRNSMKEHPPYPWTDWDTTDFTGIEIWNHMSVWMENLTEQNKYQSFVHPLRSVEKPPQESLDVWDELNQTRKVPGIGGIDAHAHRVNLLGFVEVEVFPYKVLYRSIRTYVLLPEKIEPTEDKTRQKYFEKLILEALKEGRSFVANYYHGSAKGFKFFAEQEGITYNMGDTIPQCNGVNFKVSVPAHHTAELRLIKNGEVAGTVTGNEADFFTGEKGVYRVEVMVNGKGWIYSNHIRVGI